MLGTYFLCQVENSRGSLCKGVLNTNGSLGMAGFCHVFLRGIVILLYHHCLYFFSCIIPFGNAAFYLSLLRHEPRKHSFGLLDFTVSRCERNALFSGRRLCGREAMSCFQFFRIPVGASLDDDAVVPHFKFQRLNHWEPLGRGRPLRHLMTIDCLCAVQWHETQVKT